MAFQNSHLKVVYRNKRLVISKYSESYIIGLGIVSFCKACQYWKEGIMAEVKRDNDDENGGVEYSTQFSESRLSKSQGFIGEFIG